MEEAFVRKSNSITNPPEIARPFCGCKKSWILLLILSGLIGVSALYSQKQTDSPWLHYEKQDGLSVHDKVMITIAGDGTTSVTMTQTTIPPCYMTMLSPEEMAAARTIIRAVDFFGEPDNDALPCPTDIGPKIVSITMDNQSRDLRFKYRPALDPLLHFLNRITVQAEIIHDIREHANASNALPAVDPRLDGPKVLQPHTLAEPLKTCIHNSDKSGTIECALTALSMVTEPEEWSGFLALLLEKADKNRREMLMSIITSHPFRGNIPASHLQALCPLLLTYLRDNWSSRAEQSDQEMDFIFRAFDILSSNHYCPALPFLSTIFASHDKPNLNIGITPIAYMGEKGVSLLVTYLDHASENKRMNAVELIRMAYRTHGYGKELTPVEDGDYSRMIRLYEDQVQGRLQTLAQKDASEKVRNLSEKALKDIRAEIELWTSHTGNRHP